MSEPRIISPLLDGFSLGSSMSSHSGVNCYPAMRADSDERYIVKSISVPASQDRLEALLLTGAFKNEEDARRYFQEQAQGIVREADILNKLAKQGGFLPFQGCQVEPLEEGVGYEVYLVSDYRRSLERFLRRSPMTHLAAVNMGIDLCAAMVVCRESGYLYVDLKPSNVYLTGDQGYQVGDLGFVSLKDLKYASLPDRCRSDWTPPELSDAFAQLNTTMDTYAIGLMLYQVYNNGALPFDSEESKSLLMVQLAAGDPLPAPAYADYEMAQIILKACAYDPAERWQNPIEMGRALVAYMQRNGANDVPIAPPVVQETPIAPVPVEDDAEADTEPADETVPAEEVEDVSSLSDDDAASEESDEPAAEEDQKNPENDWIDRMDAILAEDADPDSDTQEQDISLRELLTGEQFVPVSDADPNVDNQALSEETAGMLDQAEELLSIPVPEPAVAPEPIDIPIPEPIILPDEEEEVPEEADEPVIGEPSEESAEDPQEEPTVSAQNADAESYEEKEEISVSQKPAKRKKNGKKLIVVVLLLIIAVLIGFGIHYAYNEYYLQEVTSLTVDGEGNQMTVSVVSEIDESLLTVVCVDQYGKKFTAPVENGTAMISGLDPDTQYNVTLELSGRHKLIGQTSAQYYTLPQVTVTSFTSKTGPEDGSVILEFNTEGPAVENWTIQYSAEGEEPTSIPFTGDTITIPGLTPGISYQFTLLAGDEVQLIGQTQITHTASKVILAENLLVIGEDQNSLTATWTTPEGVSVDSWFVKCYNDPDNKQTMEVTEESATFTGLDLTTTYTVEILASGMSVGARTFVSANPINITSVTPSSISSDSLVVTWEYQGNEPEDGWMLLYTVDEGDEQKVIQCDDTMAVIEPVAPGSHYDFTVQAKGATVFGGTGSIDIAQADPFSKYGLAAEDIEMMLCAAPEEDGWSHNDVDEENITTAFAVGTPVGIILHTTDTYNVEYTDVTATYVLRDAEGKLDCISTSSQTWESMWNQGYCELDVPTMPQSTGSYTLELFFDGGLVATMQLTIE